MDEAGARRLQRDSDLRRLKEWRDEIPDGHHDKVGTARAVEVLAYLPLVDPSDPK